MGTVELPAEDDGGTDPGRLLSPEEVAREFIPEGEATMSREQQPADRVVDAAWWARPSRVDGAPQEQNGEDPARLVRIPSNLAAGAGGAEDDRGTDPGRVLSPEEVAREFIREGGGAALQEQQRGGSTPPRQVPVRLGHWRWCCRCSGGARFARPSRPPPPPANFPVAHPNPPSTQGRFRRLPLPPPPRCHPPPR